jgi:hypothetical protein
MPNLRSRVGSSRGSWQLHGAAQIRRGHKVRKWRTLGAPRFSPYRALDLASALGIASEDALRLAPYVDAHGQLPDS